MVPINGIEVGGKTAVMHSPYRFHQSGKRRLICFRERIGGIDVLFISPCHAETIVLLSRKNVDGYVEVDLDVSKLQGNVGASAIYAEIQALSPSRKIDS